MLVYVATADTRIVKPKGPTLETLEFAFHSGSTSTFLYFDLYLNTAYAAHYILCFSLTKGLRLKH